MNKVINTIKATVWILGITAILIACAHIGDFGLTSWFAAIIIAGFGVYTVNSLSQAISKYLVREFKRYVIDDFIHEIYDGTYIADEIKCTWKKLQDTKIKILNQES